MAKARRAKARPSRVVVPILVAALAVAGVVAWGVVPHGTDTEVGGRPSVAGAATPGTTPGRPEPSSTADPDGSAAARLTGCRARVGSADDVLAAAKTGVQDWADHVQAQTDANEGRITVADMDAVFTRTRLAGPDDQDRYRKAVTRYEDADGSCQAVAGASRKKASALTSCRERLDAQQPVLAAADEAMADWKSHLAAMVRSRQHQMDDAEEIWIAAWQAAPPHIKAYDRAAADFRDAPAC